MFGISTARSHTCHGIDSVAKRVLIHKLVLQDHERGFEAAART